MTVGGTASAAKFGIQNLTALPANGTVIANDLSTFTSQSIDGGSITAYDTEGNSGERPVPLGQVSTRPGGNSWQLFYQTNATATGTQAAWQNVGTTFTFNANGELTPPISSLTLQNLTVNGDSLGNVQLNFGTNGLTQFANAKRHRAGQPDCSRTALPPASCNRSRSTARTASSARSPTAKPFRLAQITLATFNGQNSLQALNGGAYAATPDSGPPIYIGDRQNRRQFARSLERRHRHPIQPI